MFSQTGQKQARKSGRAEGDNSVILPGFQAKDFRSLKQILDRLYRDYDFEGRVLHDPIEFPHQFKRPEDIEISGFIAACFAYGRVELFKPVIKKILSAMGDSPYDFLREFSLKKQRRLFSGISYRFNKNDDILCLLYVLSMLVTQYGTIEAAFKNNYRDSDPDTGNGLTGLMGILLSTDVSPVYGENIKPPGFRQLLPSPANGSACKRTCLFLRWMVRCADIDFGIWKDVPGNKLVIPLDTHIARISKCLGFTRRSSQDWEMAVEITGALKKLDPADPLKYDFALCHQGIAGLCSKMKCSECKLFNVSF